MSRVGTDPVDNRNNASESVGGSVSLLDSSSYSTPTDKSNSGVSVSTSTDGKRKQTVGTDPDNGHHSRTSSTDRATAEVAPADPFVAEQSPESAMHIPVLDHPVLSGDTLCATPVAKQQAAKPTLNNIPLRSDSSLSSEPWRSDESIVAEQIERKVAQCTCCTRLHLQHLEEGRYRLGTRVYYFRRFRSHVMVRVGGGWLTLDAFLERHDPCRRGKSDNRSHYVIPTADTGSSDVSLEPSPEKLTSQLPPIKPAMPLGGSMVDLRRRWSKHSTSSNESANSQTSVRSTNLIVTNKTDSNLETKVPSQTRRSRSPNPPRTRTPTGTTQRKTTVPTNRGHTATPVSSANANKNDINKNKVRDPVRSRESSLGSRRVTPSPNARGSRASSKDSKPTRWR
ncbi:unnamed protein product [Echinostoma caproni]|uniref:GAR domain-containing protein n=1 Tax=Echinostoma caproni TaxID=27848 RepID=A0A183ARZ4_9TREM|nr:unnamed protein product [Echinostoma caproni]